MTTAATTNAFCWLHTEMAEWALLTGGGYLQNKWQDSWHLLSPTGVAMVALLNWNS